MTPHKNCRYLLSSLSEYVDGDLDEALCQEIEKHMEGCEDCQIVINTLEKTVDLYHNTTELPEIPSDVRARLFKRLDLDEFLTD
jgi:anti-sigma factor RsiW